MVEVMKSQRRTSSQATTTNNNNHSSSTRSLGSRSRSSTDSRRAGGRQRPDNAVRVSSHSSSHVQPPPSSMNSSSSLSQEEEEEGNPQRQRRSSRHHAVASIARVDLLSMDMTMNMLTGGGGASGGGKGGVSSNTTGITFKGIRDEIHHAIEMDRTEAALEQSLLMAIEQQQQHQQQSLVPKSPRKTRRQKNMELKRSHSLPQDMALESGDDPELRQQQSTTGPTKRQAQPHIERRSRSFHMRSTPLTPYDSDTADTSFQTATTTTDSASNYRGDGSSSTHTSRAELLEQQGGLRHRCFSDSGDELPDNHGSQRRERSTNAFKQQAACFSQAFGGAVLPASRSTGRRASSSHPLLRSRKLQSPRRPQSTSDSVTPEGTASPFVATKPSTPTKTIATTDPLHDPNARYNPNHEKCRMLFRQSREANRKTKALSPSITAPIPCNNVHSPWHHVQVVEPPEPLDKKSKYLALLKATPKGKEPTETKVSPSTNQPISLQADSQTEEENKSETLLLKQPRESTRERIRREAAARRKSAPKTPQSAGSGLRRQRLSVNRQELSACVTPLMDDPAILSTPAGTRQRLRLSARQKSAVTAAASVGRGSTAKFGSSMQSVASNSESSNDNTSSSDKSNNDSADGDESFKNTKPEQRNSLEPAEPSSVATPPPTAAPTPPQDTKGLDDGSNTYVDADAQAVGSVNEESLGSLDVANQTEELITQKQPTPPAIQQDIEADGRELEQIYYEDNSSDNACMVGPTTGNSNDSIPSGHDSVSKINAVVSDSECEVLIFDPKGESGEVMVEKTEGREESNLNGSDGILQPVGINAPPQDQICVSPLETTEADDGACTPINSDLSSACVPEAELYAAQCTPTTMESSAPAYVTVQEVEDLNATSDVIAMRPTFDVSLDFGEAKVTNTASTSDGARKRASGRGTKKAVKGEATTLGNGTVTKRRESRRTSRPAAHRKVASGVSSSSSNIKYNSTEEELLAFFQTSAAIRMAGEANITTSTVINANDPGTEQGLSPKKKKPGKSKVTFDSTVIRYEGETATSTSTLVDGPKKKLVPVKRKKRRKKRLSESKVASATDNCNELSSSGVYLDDSDSAGDEGGTSGRSSAASKRRQKKKPGNGEKVITKKRVKKKATLLE